MAFYRATGQAHKPAPPVSTGNSAAAGAGGKAGPGEAGDRKHGMEEFIGADPIVFDHALLFKRLQSFSLEWRLQDPFASLGWFTPGQMFVLDEYCARWTQTRARNEPSPSRRRTLLTYLLTYLSTNNHPIT